MNPDEASIHDLFERWFHAMEAGDVSSALELVADDVIFKGPGGPAAIGKVALQKQLEVFHAGFNEKVSAVVEEIVVSGDWAYARIAEQAIIRAKTGGSPINVSGMHLSILCRDDAQGWQIARHVSAIDDTGHAQDRQKESV